MHSRYLLLTVLGLGMVSLADSPAKADLGTDALNVFKKHCADCHADGANEGGIGYITNLEQLVSRKKVHAKDLVNSRVYSRMIAGEMPPVDEEPTGERPTEAEIKIVADWISQGAPKPGAAVIPIPVRQPITVQAELATMQKFLRNEVPRTQREYYRFFSIRNLYNNKRCTPEMLEVYRAAFGKTINSLSWRSTIVRPLALNPERTLYAVHLRQLDWDRHLWRTMMGHYPYGLRYDTFPENLEVNDLAREVYGYTGTPVPCVRVDWFVVACTQPPLYNKLMKLPATLDGLEKMLGVNSLRNVEEGQVYRSGRINSGVSEQHRLIERHEGTFGYYWKSYDFKPNGPKANLTLFPLGPPRPNHPYPDLVFEHDGGEFIFRLPNRMQGYMITGADGKRLDDPAPIDIVSDKSKFSGTVQVVNAISCFGCHSQGIIEARDEIRERLVVRGEIRERVQLLYPKHDAMDRIFKADQESFQDATYKSMEVMVKDPSILRSPDGTVLEPVAPLAKFYIRQPLTAEDLAAELGLDDASLLRAAVKLNDQFKRIGLAPIEGKDGVIKRSTWEQVPVTRSAYQRAANYLKLGEPVIP